MEVIMAWHLFLREILDPLLKWNAQCKATLTAIKINIPLKIKRFSIQITYSARSDILTTHSNHCDSHST